MTARRRLFSDADAADLLAAVEHCRRAAANALATAPIGSPGADTLHALLDVLDRLADTLTGDRRRFWARQHSTPMGQGDKGGAG